MLQRPLQKRLAVIPIPVEDEMAESRLMRRGNLFLKYPRVRLVAISPGRPLGLRMSGKLRLAALQKLPFRPALPMQLLHAWIHMPAGKVIGPYLVSALCWFHRSCPYSGCTCARGDKFSSVHFHFASPFRSTYKTSLSGCSETSQSFTPRRQHSNFFHVSHCRKVPAPSVICAKGRSHR